MKLHVWMALAAVGAGVSGAGDLPPLFEGASTNGWILRGGKPEFRIEDGCLVGRTVKGQPNSLSLPSRGNPFVPTANTS